MSEAPPEQLGPYRIEGVVGRGGMGAVFAATHAETGERAAVKVLAPALAADDSFRERFIAEIESLKTLNHPHIVTLHGYGESDGHLYYAMELVEGTNLEQELASGRRFTWREVTQIGIDVAQALKHAHDHGIIHRDLKPANLLVNRQDEVKLTDFGIAKLFGSTSQTYGGSVLGTADYMAPEQAAGEAVTPRCDLYSLGGVMYALLSGGPPFRGKNIAEVIHKLRYEAPAPLSKVNSEVPSELQLIIDELLEKDPEDRIRTALSLTHRLRAMQQALSISTTAEDEFSSDDTLKEYDQTNRIVNPPPDIAERPTVWLPSGNAAPTEKNSLGSPLSKKKKTKRQLDHYTRVEMEHARVPDSSRGSEFSSAVPLLLLLLTVLCGLIGGVWYSSLPLSVDDLHAKIRAAAEDTNKLMTVSSDINLFIKKYPDDSRIEGVKALQEEVEIKRLQRTLETRARGRIETGKLSPVEVHCNEAFRAYREGDLETAIRKMRGIQRLFGGETRQTDIGIQRVLELSSRILPQWEKELSSEIVGLKANLEVYCMKARELSEEHPQEAALKWQGILDLYEDKPWANEFTIEARGALDALGPIDASESETKHEKEEHEE